MAETSFRGSFGLRPTTKTAAAGRLCRRNRAAAVRLGGRTHFQGMPARFPRPFRPPPPVCRAIPPSGRVLEGARQIAHERGRAGDRRPMPLSAHGAARCVVQRFRVLSCREALSCFAPERIRRMRRRGGETAKTAWAQRLARRKSKRQARSSAAVDGASPRRRSRAFGREFSWFGPKGPASAAANAWFQPASPRFLPDMENQG